MALELFKMVATLLLDKKDFDSGLKDAEDSASGMGDKIAAGLKGAGTVLGGIATAAVKTGQYLVQGGKALFDITSNVAEYGDYIDETSQKLGISASAFQAWDSVLQKSGTSMGNMQGAFSMLTKLMQGGTKGQAEALAMLGVEWEDIADLSKEDLFATLILELQNMEDAAKRDYIAMGLLGGAGAQLAPVLNMNKEELSAMLKEAQSMGGWMGDDAVKNAAAFEDGMDNIHEALNGAKIALVSDFMPGITQVVNGLATMLTGGNGFFQINEGIKDFVASLSENAPKMAELAKNIITTLLDALDYNSEALIEAGLNAIVTIGMGIIENLPRLLEVAAHILTALVQGITQNLPTLIPALISVVMQCVETLTSPDSIGAFIGAALQLIVALAEGLIKSLPELIRSIPTIIENIVEAITSNLDDLVFAALQIIIALAIGLVEAIPELITAIPYITEAIVNGLVDGIKDIVAVGGDMIKGLWQGIKDMATWAWDRIKEWWQTLLDHIKDFLGIHSPSTVFSGFGKNLIEGLINGIKEMWENLKSLVSNVANSIKDGISEKVESAKNWGRDLIQNFIGGIKEKWENFKSTISNIANTVKDFLGFSEPKMGPLSNFHTYAPDMMALFAQGIRDNRDLITDAIDSAFNVNPAYSLAGNMNVQTVARPDRQYQGEMLAALRELKNLRVVMDTGETVGALASPMDGALGTQYIYRKRGII